MARKRLLDVDDGVARDVFAGEHIRLDISSTAARARV
jgi:hypothetical protein